MPPLWPQAAELRCCSLQGLNLLCWTVVTKSQITYEKFVSFTDSAVIIHKHANSVSFHVQAVSFSTSLSWLYCAKKKKVTAQNSFKCVVTTWTEQFWSYFTLPRLFLFRATPAAAQGWVCKKNFQTFGASIAVVDQTPDMISSVMSRPPWLGSRIRICQDIELNTTQVSTTRDQHWSKPHSHWLQSYVFLTVIIRHDGVFCFFQPFDLWSVKWRLFVVTTSLRSLFGGHLEPEAACEGTCWGTNSRKAAGWTNGKYCVWAA